MEATSVDEGTSFKCEGVRKRVLAYLTLEESLGWCRRLSSGHEGQGFESLFLFLDSHCVVLQYSLGGQLRPDNQS